MVEFPRPLYFRPIRKSVLRYTVYVNLKHFLISDGQNEAFEIVCQQVSLLSWTTWSLGNLTIFCLFHPDAISIEKVLEILNTCLNIIQKVYTYSRNDKLTEFLKIVKPQISIFVELQRFSIRKKSLKDHFWKMKVNGFQTVLLENEKLTIVLWTFSITKKQTKKLLHFNAEIDFLLS